MYLRVVDYETNIILNSLWLGFWLIFESVKRYAKLVKKSIIQHKNIFMSKCMETFLKYFIYDHHVVNIKMVQIIVI